MRSHDGLGRGSASSAGSARLLVALTAALASLTACLPRGHVEVPAQSRASGDPAAVWGQAQPARYGGTGADDGNRLGDTPAPADDRSRGDAQLASATRTMPHINEVARREGENAAFVAASGKWTVFRVDEDPLYTSLMERALRHVQPIRNQFGSLSGVRLEFDGGTVLFFLAAADEAWVLPGNFDLASWDMSLEDAR